MHPTPFPRTTVAGVSVSRLIIGTNWMLGWSHRSPSEDKHIRERFPDAKSAYPMLKTFLNAGVDTIMGPMSPGNVMRDAIRYAQEQSGQPIIVVDTPIINVDDSEAARQEARATIRRSKEYGASFCLLHHSSVEQLVNKNRHEITRLPDYLDMIRQAGLIPGLSAHMPELVLYSDEQGYDVETYIQLYNAAGFLMQIEVETIAAIINNANKPVMTIKPMAAGRLTPYVGLNFVWNTIRGQDMVTAGCTNADQAAEVIEISRAAIERRYPDIGKRASPNARQDAFSGGTKS